MAASVGKSVVLVILWSKVQSEVEFVEVGGLERSISLTKVLHKLKGGIVDQPKYRMAE